MSSSASASTAPTAPAPAAAKRVKKVFTAASTIPRKADPPKRGAVTIAHLDCVVVGSPQKLPGRGDLTAVTVFLIAPPKIPSPETTVPNGGACKPVLEQRKCELIQGGRAMSVQLMKPDLDSRARLAERRKNGESTFETYERHPTTQRGIIKAGHAFRLVCSQKPKDDKTWDPNGIYRFGIKEFQLVQSGASSAGDYIEPQVSEVEYLGDYLYLKGEEADWALYGMYNLAQTNPLFTQIIVKSDNMLEVVKQHDCTPSTAYMLHSWVLPLARDHAPIFKGMQEEGAEVVRVCGDPSQNDNNFPTAVFDVSKSETKFTDVMEATIAYTQKIKIPGVSEDAPVEESYQNQEFDVVVTLWEDAVRGYGAVDLRHARAGMAGPARMSKTPAAVSVYCRGETGRPYHIKSGAEKETLKFSTSGKKDAPFDQRSMTVLADLPIGVVNAGYCISQKYAFLLLDAIERARIIASGGVPPPANAKNPPEPRYASVRMNKVVGRKSDKGVELKPNYLKKGMPLVNVLECNDNVKKAYPEKDYFYVVNINAGNKSSDILADGTEDNFSDPLVLYRAWTERSSELFSGADATPEEAKHGPFTTKSTFVDNRMGELLLQIFTNTCTDLELREMFPLPNGPQPGTKRPVDIELWVLEREYAANRCMGMGLTTTSTHNEYHILQSLATIMFPDDLSYLDDVGSGLGKVELPCIDPVTVEYIPPPPSAVDTISEEDEEAAAKMEAEAIAKLQAAKKPVDPLPSVRGAAVVSADKPAPDVAAAAEAPVVAATAPAGIKRTKTSTGAAMKRRIAEPAAEIPDEPVAHKSSEPVATPMDADDASHSDEHLAPVLPLASHK